MTRDRPYDVFLSHAHADAAWVERLAARLEDEAGLRVWLDKWVLVPGRGFEPGMARGVLEAESCVVCIGNEIPAGWHQLEIQLALNRQAGDPSYGVIAVLLPGADTANVTDFLRLNSWVDLRAGLDDEEGFRRLVAGIRGEMPGREPDEGKPGAWPRYWEAGLARYLERMQALHATLRVLGHPRPVPLEGIYTDLYILEAPTASRRVDLRDLCDEPSGLGNRKRVDGFQFITEPEACRLVILGKPGAGKTTFLKYVVLQAVQGKLDRVPILISLREWSDAGERLVPYIVRQFESCGFANAGPFVERILAEGRALVLFDGLDEVSRGDGRRDAAIAALDAFGKQYWESQCLIACRVAVTEYQFERYSYVEMADFTDAQVETYARKWFADHPSRAERFLNEIARAEHAHLRGLSRTPLLLSLLCLAFGEAGTFPQHRAEIYGEALDALLRRWDAARHIERDEAYGRLSLGRKRQLLAQLAVETFERGEVFFPKARLARQIAACVRSVVPVAPEDEVDGEAVLRAIEAQHGILVEWAHDIYAFAHPMFQEYFAAVYLAEPTNLEALWQVLDEHVADDRWRELFLLTASMLDNADRFFVQFSEALQRLVREDKAIVGLLSWAEEQADRAGGRGLEPKAMRSLFVDVALDLARVLARARAFDLALDHDLARARALASNLTFDLDRARTLDRVLGLTLDRRLDRIRNLTLDLDVDFDLVRDRDRIRGRDRIGDRVRIRDRVLDLTRVLELDIDLDLDLDFDAESAQRLATYLDACWLYVECLDVAYLSDREGLRDRILRAPSTIMN